MLCEEPTPFGSSERDTCSFAGCHLLLGLEGTVKKQSKPKQHPLLPYCAIHDCIGLCRLFLRHLSQAEES